MYINTSSVLRSTFGTFSTVERGSSRSSPRRFMAFELQAIIPLNSLFSLLLLQSSTLHFNFSSVILLPVAIVRAILSIFFYPFRPLRDLNKKTLETWETLFRHCRFALDYDSRSLLRSSRRVQPASPFIGVALLHPPSIRPSLSWYWVDLLCDSSSLRDLGYSELLERKSVWFCL